ncbi:MAG: ABC transporter permease [Lachnospiraceae bacterium]|jgi:ABC-type antimicrobial peptide transport system permease subunit|nr:ABC transporter permease [Lachnospiraceae bacterium]MCI9397096.1 ABC transporter permease [Lachnospiraceae bacterium]
MFSYVCCSIKRRKTQNLVTVGISVMLVLLLNLYFGSIRSYQTQLADLSENVPIFCQITNLNGTMGNELFISEQIVEALEQSAYVKDLSYMTVVMAGEGDFKEIEYSKYLNLYVVGANDVEAVGEMTADMFSLDEQSLDELLASDRMECIVNEEALIKRGWEIGDRITLKCYYYDPASEFQKIQLHSMGGTVEVTIAGTMKETEGKTNAIQTDIIIPGKASRNLFAQFGLKFFADTVTFHVNNPLDLNGFKEEMQDIGLMEIVPEAGNSYTGYALVVRDADFIASATHLRHSTELMQSFLPVVCILVLLIGYVVSYLAGNSRREEFALMRLQGVKKLSAAFLFLTEQMILVLIGNVAGDVLVLPASSSVSGILTVNGVLLTAYLIGAAAAYGRMSMGSVVYLLSVQQ